MEQLKGSKTEKNIMAALQGESLARNRYTFFEEQALKEGNNAVAKLYSRMVKNEMYHARVWFRLLGGFDENSEANLKLSAAGEEMESTSMYPEFAAIAREEGFEEVALLFDRVAEIEKDHEKTFRKAYEELVSKREEKEGQKDVPKTVYRCEYCGALYDEKPRFCSICGF